MPDVKAKIMSLFKRNSPNIVVNQNVSKSLYGGGKKSSKLKMQKQSDDYIIKNIRKLKK